VFFVPGESPVAFLTVRVEEGRWLAGTAAHDALRTVWEEAEGWAVGDYLLMPDHLHCFCGPLDGRFDIEQWITFWKRRFRRLHGNEHWRFQSRGWHHRLRSDESYGEKWEYVRDNSVRAGLVQKAEDWPFQGRISELRR
jgi:putative transposase